MPNRIAIAVHGGAGVMRGMTPLRQKMYCKALESALDAGHRILAGGGASLDAVTAAVPCFELEFAARDELWSYVDAVA